MKYSYVAISAAALATGASAAPLSLSFGKQSQTANTNGGIMHGKRDNSGFGNDIHDGSNSDWSGAEISLKRDNSGFGNDIHDGSNSDWSGASISLKRDNSGFGNDIHDGSNSAWTGATINLKRAPLGSAFFGNQESTANQNGGIVSMAERDNSGFGNDVHDASNSDWSGASISLKRSPLGSLFAGSSDQTQNVNGGIAHVTPEQFQAMKSAPAQRRTDNSGFGNDIHDGSNSDWSGASISLKRSPLGLSFGNQEQTQNQNGGIAHVTPEQFQAMRAPAQRRTDNSGFGNDIHDGSNSDWSGASISLKRSPLGLSFGNQEQTQNQNGGIAHVTPEQFQAMRAPAQRRTDNSGFGNDIHDGSNSDWSGASISLKRSPLGSIFAGSSDQTSNQNGGIAHVTPAQFQAMKSAPAQRRTDNSGFGNDIHDGSNSDWSGASISLKRDNSGFGNDVHDASNSDWSGASISLKRSPLGSAFFGNQESTANQNGGIVNMAERDNSGFGNDIHDGSNSDWSGASISLKRDNSGFGNDVHDASNSDWSGASISLKRDTNIGFGNDLKDGSSESFHGAKIDLSNSDLLA